MNESGSLVSIIIPAWNHGRELMECLKSIETQTYRSLEIVVVDDASTDETQTLLAAYRSSLPFKTIRLEMNRGAAAARNEGARLASGEYLLFVDADAALRPDAIQRMAETLEARPDASFSYSSFRFGWKKFKSRLFDAAELRRRPYIHTTALVRRTAFPGFDESLKKFQDWDLWLTVAERGGTGVWIHEVLFKISVGRKGMSRWLPSVFHVVPWEWIGWLPRELKNYRYWERVVKEKHGIKS